MNGGLNIINYKIKAADLNSMLKKFTKKSSWPRKSIARDIEAGMKEMLEKEKRGKQSKRVLKMNKRYV